VYVLSLRASNSSPFTTGVSGKGLRFDTKYPLRSIIYTVSDPRRAELDFDGILLHVLTKYTGAGRLFAFYFFRFLNFFPLSLSP